MKPLSENRSPSPKYDRKVTKPLIEKKRRARINASLAELKTLLEAVLGAEIPRDSKMEKADILELAVKHLRRINRGTMNVASMMDPSVMDKYKVGYSECANDIARYLSANNGTNAHLRTRLMEHLSHTMPGATSDNQQNYVMTQNMNNRQRLSPIENSRISQQMTSPITLSSRQMTSHNTLSSNEMTSQNTLSSHQITLENARLTAPIYVAINDKRPIYFTSSHQIRAKNPNHVTVSQPIRNVQPPTLLIATPIQSLLTPLHTRPVIKPEVNANVWRPW